jgi:hypothetical protein
LGRLRILIFQQALGGKQFQGRGEILWRKSAGHQLLNFLGSSCAVEQWHDLVEKLAEGVTLQRDPASLGSDYQSFVARAVGGIKTE